MFIVNQFNLTDAHSTYRIINCNSLHLMYPTQPNSETGIMSHLVRIVGFWSGDPQQSLTRQVQVTRRCLDGDTVWHAVNVIYTTNSWFALGLGQLLITLLC